jgi:cystathionine beta-lyase
MSLLNYKDRKGTNCAKWDTLGSKFGNPDLLAMWVADMDFKEPECVTKALRRYVDETPFGYYVPSQSYYDAFIQWEYRYHGYKVDPAWMCFAPGVVQAINWILHFSTQPGDAIIVLTPVYYPFLDAVKNNDRKLVQCDLIRNGMDYFIDFEKFENDIVKNHVKLFVMSSPHNPIGRVWKPEELRQLMEICRKHGVMVISDEIHQDFLFADHVHYPTASLGDYDKFLITMTAPSKTFNLAALQNAIVIIPDEELREKYQDYLNRMRYMTGNAFGYIAAEAAFLEGRPWLDELLAYIYDNYLYIKDTLAQSAPDISVVPLQGTYLLWVNFENRFKTNDEMCEFAQNKCGIAPDFGSWFGGDKFASFIRLNLATSRKNIETAVGAIIRELKK